MQLGKWERGDDNSKSNSKIHLGKWESISNSKSVSNSNSKVHLGKCERGDGQEGDGKFLRSVISKQTMESKTCDAPSRKIQEMERNRGVAFRPRQRQPRGSGPPNPKP